MYYPYLTSICIVNCIVYIEKKIVLLLTPFMFNGFVLYLESTLSQIGPAVSLAKLKTKEALSNG